MEVCRFIVINIKRGAGRESRNCVPRLFICNQPICLHVPLCSNTVDMGPDDNISADRPDAARPGAPVCRYFLKGGCFRADCWYSHDASRWPFIQCFVTPRLCNSMCLA